VSRRRNILGRLCRRGLLALAVLACLGVGASALHATAGIAADLHAGSVTPDMIWQADRDKMYMISYAYPPIPQRRVLSFVGWPGRGLIFMPSHGKHLILTVGTAPVGIHRLDVKGVPYGAFAFEKSQPIFQVVPPGCPVVMVDARLAVRALDEERQTVLEAVELLRRRGVVVFFHPGPLYEYENYRRMLREAFPDSPVACVVDDKKPRDPWRTLNVTWQDLNRPKDRPDVVTDQADLAATLARAAVFTHLIAPPESGVSENSRLRRHDSLVKFKEYLAMQPITGTSRE